MKMKIESLMASRGDSFIVTWTYLSNDHTILIDCGVKDTYRFIKKKLRGISKLDGIFITHVDYDHIGGMLAMIDDKNCPIELDFPIFINTPELIVTNSKSDKVGYGHGTALESVLNEKKITKKAIYTSLYRDDILTINGLKLTVLSPNQEVLHNLKKKWTKTTIYEKYLQENSVEGKVSQSNSALLTYDEIISAEERIHKWQDDLINSSSMAFLLENEGVRVLFLGDSNPSIVEDALIRRGYSKKRRLRVDFVKLSHHGSKFNTSKNLLSMIDCDCYFISTSGGGPYYHPHRETIIRISEYSRKDSEQVVNIYTNYDLQRSRFIGPEEEQALNLNFAARNEFIWD